MEENGRGDHIFVNERFKKKNVLMNVTQWDRLKRILTNINNQNSINIPVLHIY